MGHRFVVVVLVVAAVVLAAPATTVGASGPADLVCGQTITTSVVLRRDLACRGDGLVIVANGVTLDLAGHSITSIDGTGAGVRRSAPEDDPGAACLAGVEVRGGTISGSPWGSPAGDGAGTRSAASRG